MIGFGFLRLPQVDGAVDYGAGCALVDRFLELGGRYFDTAYTYLDGQSEEAIRRCLVERHPRESYHLADKLPGFAAKSEEDSLRIFETSLKRCGVSYFDTYLLHGLNEENYEIAKKFRQFKFLQEMKAQGRVKRIGFSFHDCPELLDRILTEHPEVECVLLQINYLDWHSPALRASELYETARRHGKAILIMEPVKGGSLASPPVELGLPGSPASWAIRFAAGLPGVETVLSGMNTIAQIEEMSMEERLSLVKPVEELFLEAPEVILPDFFAKLCRSGCEIYQKKIKTSYDVDTFIRICDKDGFFALGQVNDYDDGTAIKAIKLFKL